ncbi:hypothetical protein [Ilumatobacter sp.]|uniref:hypothetical protein n=1 Tax=Ilumatobacter sp. TaxID=1967498 RepID=UPI003750068B
MSYSHAEQLDPTVLGEEVGDTGRPGDDFPRDEPLAVEDPSIIAHGVIARDDVASRDERLVPEAEERDAANGASTMQGRPAGLVDPAMSTATAPSIDDDEQQLIATESVEQEQSPEARALHEEPSE